jgi:pyruvate,water dikinase
MPSRDRRLWTGEPSFRYVNPDEFFVSNRRLSRDTGLFCRRSWVQRNQNDFADTATGKSTEIVPTVQEDRDRFSITEDDVLTLARWTAIIEDHYSQQAGYFKPMDIEWGKDGISNELFILQARPETVESQRDVNVLESYVLLEKKPPVITGTSVGSKIGSGPVHIIESVSDIKSFKKGEVLVTDMMLRGGKRS